MDTASENRVWSATVDSSGRVLLPAELRHAMHAKVGTPLLWVKDERGLHLKSFEESLAEIQDYYQSLSPAEDIWTEALIQQRHAEAAND